jgi:FKBP-type peptidyl-prolyl cis-trans isomerase 2
MLAARPRNACRAMAICCLRLMRVCSACGQATRSASVIPAADAFGLRQDANLKRVPRNKFAEDIELVPGLVVSFAAAEGGELPGVVHRLMGDMVEIDFNHPLAGRDIVFDIEIVDVVVDVVVDKEHANQTR